MRTLAHKLYAQVKTALANPSVKDRIVADAGAPMDMPLDEVEPFVKAEIVKWADVVKRSGVSVQ